MILAALEATQTIPQWIQNLSIVAISLIASLSAVKFNLKVDILKIEKSFISGIADLKVKLEDHIKSDEAFHTKMSKQLEENTIETKKNSTKLKPFTDNEVFFKELIHIGSLGSIDIRKFIRQQYDDEVITEEQEIEIDKECAKVNLYINRTMDSLAHFCRNIMTVGIEDINSKMVYSKASTSIQTATKLFSELWGTDNSIVYVRSGREDREILLKEILALSTDLANAKSERFRIKSKDYAHKIIAGLCIFYYTNKLNKYIEVEND